MPLSHSFQLPDLLGIISCLELRTNQFCRFATDTSEKWFFEETNCISPAELSYLRSTKFGLLAALCFPTCDAPQLRLLTDFLTMLFYSNIRIFSFTNTPTEAMWPTTEQKVCNDENATHRESGLEILGNHVLFKHVIDPRISRLVPAAPNAWKSRFSHSVQLFQAAQTKMIQNHGENIIPTLEEYLQLGREINGSSMILDLSELLEITQFPELQGEDAQKLLNLERTAFDVIAWSMDVSSHQFDLAKGNKHNLVAILMHHKNLSLQGAVNLAGNMIKDAFATFCCLERSLLESVSTKKTIGLPILSWIWTSFAPTNSYAGTFSNETLTIVQDYITRLKDYIVGTINWLYETELYFGKKGSEIRTFGWVFITPIAVQEH